jgi:FkbM family methyltransferase
VVARVAEYIEPGTVALDVGASVGLWTVQLGKIAASRGALVWAFEPNPANTAWIRRNVALNDLSSTVTLREMGLGDTEESLILVGSEYGVGNGAIELDPQAGTEKHPRIPITLGRLDDVELPARVSFIKIDVEGYEAEALAGLSAPVPALSFEFTTIQRDVACACVARCDAIGYRAFEASLGESLAFAHARKLSAGEIIDWLLALPADANSGDIYATL